MLIWMLHPAQWRRSLMHILSFTAGPLPRRPSICSRLVITKSRSVIRPKGISGNIQALLLLVSRVDTSDDQFIPSAFHFGFVDLLSVRRKGYFAHRWFFLFLFVRKNSRNTHQLCRCDSFVRKKPRFAHHIDSWSPVVANPCVETAISRTDSAV